MRRPRIQLNPEEQINVIKNRLSAAKSYLKKRKKQTEANANDCLLVKPSKACDINSQSVQIEAIDSKSVQMEATSITRLSKMIRPAVQSLSRPSMNRSTLMPSVSRSTRQEVNKAKEQMQIPSLFLHAK